MASDLSQATQLLTDIELSHGLGENLIFVAPAGSSGLSAYLYQQPDIKQRIETLLQACMQRSVSLLNAHLSALVSIADTIGKNNKISADEARHIVDTKSIKSGGYGHVILA